MRRFAAALFVLALVSLNVRDAAAQPSAEDLAAYSAITGTPVGTFTPVLMMKGMKGKYGVSGRYGMFSPKTGDGDNSIGATGFMELGQNAVVGATAGYRVVGCPSGSTCDNGLLLGGDIVSTLWSSAGNTPNSMHVNFQGSLGWGSFGDFSFMSAVVGAPLVWTRSMAKSALTAIPQGASGSGHFSLYFVPGFGWGRMSFDLGTSSGNESGTRPMFGIGGEFVTAGGVGFHAGYHQVMIEDGGSNIGLGVTFQVGQRAAR